jgi:hypothetical protein
MWIQKSELNNDNFQLLKQCEWLILNSIEISELKSFKTIGVLTVTYKEIR